MLCSDRIYLSEGIDIAKVIAVINEWFVIIGFLMIVQISRLCM